MNESPARETRAGIYCKYFYFRYLKLIYALLFPDCTAGGRVSGL